MKGAALVIDSQTDGGVLRDATRDLVVWPWFPICSASS
jgi:hypothetical protein